MVLLDLFLDFLPIKTDAKDIGTLDDAAKLRYSQPGLTFTARTPRMVALKLSSNSTCPKTSHRKYGISGIRIGEISTSLDITLIAAALEKGDIIVRYCYYSIATGH